MRSCTDARLTHTPLRREAASHVSANDRARRAHHIHDERTHHITSAIHLGGTHIGTIDDAEEHLRVL